jgi:hypothetical protein
MTTILWVTEDSVALETDENGEYVEHDPFLRSNYAQ